MLTLQELGWFALAALMLVVTPGPNMIYWARCWVHWLCVLPLWKKDELQTR